jgi:hypothetical protein
VRALRIGLLALVAAPIAAAAGGGAASHACSARIGVRLPAQLTVHTARGTFALRRGGGVCRFSGDPQPVPEGASWWPNSGIWERIDRGQLVVGRWQRTVWRSRRRFAHGYEIGAIAVSRQGVAFSYGARRQRLFVAAPHGPEQLVARGEFPLGWTSNGLYTRSDRGGRIFLRGSGGTLLARGVRTYAYDSFSHSLYFVSCGWLMLDHGGSERALADLGKLGLALRDLQILPLGRRVGLEDSRRLVVLRQNGSAFASTLLPRGTRRADGVSAQPVAATDGSAVAFAATSGNTAYGSRGTETVYLLKAGATVAQPIHTERVEFAICERGADLAWHGPWLLYDASEGNTALIDTRTGHAMELTRLVHRVARPYASNEGDLNFNIAWS